VGEKVSKKKWFVRTTLLACLVSLFTLIWFYNHKIIDGDYHKLTITKMGKTTDVIVNKDEIDKIINQINTSPRTFNPNISGFRYDYMPYGILIFENDKEKFKIGFIIPKGNVLTKHWEVETNFGFGKDLK
jgi:hypothetical protein